MRHKLSLFAVAGALTAALPVVAQTASVGAATAGAIRSVSLGGTTSLVTGLGRARARSSTGAFRRARAPVCRVTGAKRAKSNPQFNAGFEGLNLYQQRFARRGNQFTVEPPEAWLGRELDETAVTPGAADVGPGPGTVAAAGAASGAALVAVVRAVFEVVAVVGVPETPVPLSPCAGAFGAPHAASAIAPASGSPTCTGRKWASSRPPNVTRPSVGRASGRSEWLSPIPVSTKMPDEPDRVRASRLTPR